MRPRMEETWPIVAIVGALLVLGACRESREAQGADATTTVIESSSSTTTATTEPSTTTTLTPTTSVTPATPVASSTTSTTAATPSTTAPASTTTSVAPAEPTPRCVRRIRPGDSLEAIVGTIGNAAVTVEGLQAENGIADPDLINAGDDLDICVGNGINDTTGQPREPEAPPPTDPMAKAVRAQQRKLNKLFAGTGLPPLAVDGDSGRLTRQQLCAARLALDLPVSREDMTPGSAEEQALMSTRSLSMPSGAPVGAGRWVLIDRTCQIMFAGEGAERLVFVFQTSTGSPGYETRDQNGVRVFRFDPARENGGWHNSTHYPVPADNPLNGNMYLPLYFDAGQAIHGANNVPTDPQSKGCVRLRVDSQDALVGWLGLGDVPSPVWDPDDINLTVSVQGQY